MSYPWPTPRLACRLPGSQELSLISWINQELGTLPVESSRPPRLACAWENECVLPAGPRTLCAHQCAHIHHLSEFHTRRLGGQGGEQRSRPHGRRPGVGWILPGVWDSASGLVGDSRGPAVSFPFPLTRVVSWDLSPLGPPQACPRTLLASFLTTFLTLRATYLCSGHQQSHHLGLCECFQMLCGHHPMPQIQQSKGRAFSPR